MFQRQKEMLEGGNWSRTPEYTAHADISSTFSSSVASFLTHSCFILLVAGCVLISAPVDVEHP